MLHYHGAIRTGIPISGAATAPERYLMTQMDYAGMNIATPQIKHVAEIEQLPEELILKGAAEGKIVIPCNINHKNIVPCGIGRILRTKINANIGNSTLSSCPGAEKSKLNIALHYGADTVMDLSTGGEITSIRQAILAECTAPLHPRISQNSSPHSIKSTWIREKSSLMPPSRATAPTPST